MFPNFFFKNLNPTTDLRQFAVQSIGRILDMAPYGSSAFAVLEKQENDFRCSIDIYSIKGPFTASAVGATAEDAVLSASDRLSHQVKKWSQDRTSWIPRFLELAT